MSLRRLMKRCIPHRPHFYVKINDDVAGTIDAFENAFRKNGFQTIDFGFFCHPEGNVRIRYCEHFRKRPKASVWCFPSSENAGKPEIEAFAERVQRVIQAVPGVKVRRDDSLLYEKRYAIVRFPDDTFSWVEPPVLWFDDYFKDPVVSYIWQRMQIDLKNHRKFFEIFLARAPDPKSIDKNLDILHHYHYSTIFWLAASRMNLDQLVRLIGITDRKRTQLSDGSFKFKLQVALCAFLTNMSSSLDALAQIVNLMCLSKPKGEEERVSFKEILKWIRDSPVDISWKVDVSQLRKIFLKPNGHDYTPLIKKYLEMMDYRNVVVHRRLMPLIGTVDGTYTVNGEAGRLFARDETGSISSQSRSVAVHIPHLEADVDKGLATIAITVSRRPFLPKIRKRKLVYDYPIDRSDFKREDVLLQFEKYYECVSSLIEKVYAALLDMQRHKD